MNVAVVLLLSSLVPAQFSPDQTELKLVFDQTHLRLGDLAYCEVQVWNRSDRVQALPVPDQIGSLYFEVTAAGITFKPHICGGMGGVGSQPVRPGECIKVPEQVFLCNEAVLKRWNGNGGKVTVRASLMGKGIDGIAWVSSAPVTLDVQGQVAPMDLLLKVYASYQTSRRMLEEAGSLEKHWGTLYGVAMYELLLQDYIPKQVLDRLVDGVHPDTAFYREATMARLLDEFCRLGTMKFETFKERLLVILAKCGSAEGRWLIRQAGSGMRMRQMEMRRHRPPQEAKWLFDLDLETELQGKDRKDQEKPDTQAWEEDQTPVPCLASKVGHDDRL